MKTLFSALLKAKTEFPTLHKGSKVDMTLKSGRKVNYDYADLCEDIQTIIDPILLQNGLSYIQPLDVLADGYTPGIRTILFHESGEMLQFLAPLLFDKEMTAQDLGGTITYFRRYSLVSFLGLRTSDQDADANHSVIPERNISPQNPFGSPQPKPDGAGKLVNFYANHQGLPNKAPHVASAPPPRPAVTPQPSVVDQAAKRWSSPERPSPPLKSAPTPEESKHRKLTKEEMGGFVITFGKFKNKELREIRESDAISYVDYLETMAMKEGKDMGAQAKALKEMVWGYFGLDVIPSVMMDEPPPPDPSENIHF